MHMRNRLFQVTSAMTIALGVAMSMAVLVAQAPSGTKKALPQTTTSTDAAIKASADAFKKSVELKTYVVPKKPWGEPDLSGVWLTATYTRLQRPAELGDKEFYTEEEAIAEYKKAAESDAEVDPRTVHYDWKEYAMDAWQGGATPNLLKLARDGTQYTQADAAAPLTLPSHATILSGAFPLHHGLRNNGAGAFPANRETRRLSALDLQRSPLD